jgi:hypothetical protein
MVHEYADCVERGNVLAGNFSGGVWDQEEISGDDQAVLVRSAGKVFINPTFELRNFNYCPSNHPHLIFLILILTVIPQPHPPHQPNQLLNLWRGLHDPHTLTSVHQLSFTTIILGSDIPPQSLGITQVQFPPK